MRGEGGRHRLLVIQPLFEELNRTRRLLALTTAALAGAGVETWLADLPGTGDHEDAAMDWDRWRAALAALAATLGPVHTLAARGGCLLDDAVPAIARYRFAPPASGAKQLRDLLRARAAVDDGRPVTVAGLEAALARGETIEAAGYAITSALAAALRAAELPSGPARTAALAPGSGVDAVLGGPMVWRQSEPLPAPALAAALAADVAQWLAARS